MGETARSYPVRGWWLTYEVTSTFQRYVEAPTREEAEMKARDLLEAHGVAASELAEGRRVVRLLRVDEVRPGAPPMDLPEDEDDEPY